VLPATGRGFHQNFWIDGEPYWRGIQLDEVAFRSCSPGSCTKARALREFDPYPMVLRAAGYLMREGRSRRRSAGREQRLLALDARVEHRRAHLRGLPRP